MLCEDCDIEVNASGFTIHDDNGKLTGWICDDCYNKRIQKGERKL